MTKPTMKPQSQPLSPIQPSDDLNKVINESRNEIHAATEEVIAKKRGRPSKDSKKEIPLVQPQLSPATQKMSVEGYKAMLAGVLNLAGIYLNKASETKCFTLEKEELELITAQGAECMMEFVPTVESKYMKLAGFSIVLVSVYGMKYSQFSEIHIERVKKKKEAVVNAEISVN